MSQQAGQELAGELATEPEPIVPSTQYHSKNSLRNSSNPLTPFLSANSQVRSSRARNQNQLSAWTNSLR